MNIIFTTLRRLIAALAVRETAGDMVSHHERTRARRPAGLPPAGRRLGVHPQFTSAALESASNEGRLQ